MKISIIIPVFNEVASIKKLLDSIQAVDYPIDDFEVVVVDDGSNDGTGEAVKDFKSVRLVTHTENKGRFDARKTGMEEAKYENLLFVDSRCLVPKEILNNLSQKKDNVLIGHSRGQEKETIFEVFYSAIRKLFFRKFYKEMKGRIILNKNNFDIYPKGMGVFFIKKEILSEIVNKYANTFNKESSEDTRLFSYILEKDNIVIDPDIWIINYGRSDTKKSLEHIIERGVHYTDYYLGTRSLKHWLILILPVLLLSIFSILLTYGIYEFILFSVIIWLFISFYLNSNPTRAIQIFTMGPILAGLFYVGIVKGLFKILLKQSVKQHLLKILMILILVGCVIYLKNNFRDFGLILTLTFWQILILSGFNLVLLFINGIFSWYLYKQFDIKLGKVEAIALAVATSFGNTFLPFRAGMGGVAIYLKKRHGLSYSYFASTIAGVYIINFFIVGFLGLISMLILYLTNGVFSIIVAIAFLGLSSGAILSITASNILFRFIPLPGLKVKFNMVIEGWHILAKVPRNIIIMGLITLLNSITVGGLLLYQFKFLGIVKSDGTIVKIWDTIFLSSFSVLSIFLNITPSALGIKEGFLAFASQVINISAQNAIIVSVLDRIIGVSVLLVLGPLSFYYLKKTRKIN